MQVVLVSLRGTGEAVVYDRQMLNSSQLEDWLGSTWPVRGGMGTLESTRSGNMRHLLTAAALVVVSTVLVYLGLSNARLLPLQASLQARPIDQLFNFYFGAIAFLFSLIIVFILYSVVVFRRKPGETGDGLHMRGITRLEVTWTVVPLVAVLFLSYFGAQNLAETVRVDPQAMVVNVTGGQWFWSFEYPDQGVTSDALYLPVNKQVLLRMTSRDVIHSFWVPEFRVKQDLLPGENLVKELRITPTEIGAYKVRCAEMCGTSHAFMESPVIVVEQAEFDAWLRDQAAAVQNDPVARGQKLARDNGCIACHSLDGSQGVGPTWKGLLGSTVQQADGSTIQVDQDYLVESILDPRVKIHAGYPENVMPDTYDELFSEQQVMDIVAFIESVK
jgi:cytochrome c oxidase subunit 2